MNLTQEDRNRLSLILKNKGSQVKEQHQNWK